MPITLPTVKSGYNLGLINDNFQTIEDAWDEKLDRLVSTQGNFMEQTLDMNSNEIINTKVTDNPTSLVTKEYVDALFNAIDGAEGIVPIIENRQQGDGVTTLFNSPATEQAPAASFFIQIDGITQRPITDFSATGAGKIQFTEAPPLFSDVDITWFEPANLGDVITVDRLSGLTAFQANSVSDMLAGLTSGGEVVVLKVGQYWCTGGTHWLKTLSGNNIESFKALGPVLVDDYGAKGDALLSRGDPLYHTINGVGGITNPAATNDTAAISEAIANHSHIVFSGERGYLVDQCFVIEESNKHIDGQGAVIVYRGGKNPSTDITGVFQVSGVYDSFDSQATPKSGIETFADFIDVDKASNTLVKGDFCLFKARNDATDFSTEVVTAVFANVKVRKVEEIDATTQRLFFDYKSGFEFTQAQISIGKSLPVCDGSIENFQFIDEMAATPSPDGSTEAPAIEKSEAVGLVRLGCVSNYRVENIVGYKGKYSLFDCQIGNNVSTKNIKNYNPVWFGPGEGYCERWGSSIYSRSANLHMTGGRHVIDYTKCGWMKVSNASGDTNQVSFSCHTNSEHDIEFENCQGGSFYLANSSFGNSCARITLKGCNFDKVLANCLHLIIKDSQLNDFIATVSKMTIQNSNIKEFKSIAKETRAFSGDIINAYAENGKLVIDGKSSLTRAKDYGSGTRISGFFVADIKGRISTESGDTIPSMLMTSNPSFSFSGELRNTSLLIGGRALAIDITDAEVVNTEATLVGSAVSINSIDVRAGEVQEWRLFNNKFTLNGTQRPFQIVSRGDSVQAYDALVSGGGNIMNNTAQAQIDDNGVNFNLLGLSYTRDAYSDGSDTFLRAADAVLYKANETAATKGSTGGPAIRDASNSSWVDLT